MDSKKIIEEFDRQQKSSKKHKKNHPREPVKGKPNKEKVETEEPAGYRDRARERREGLNKDDLRFSNPTIDEHLGSASGLDFSLLERIRNDLKAAEKSADAQDKADELGDPDSDSEEEEFRREAIIAASSTASSKRQLVDIEKLKKGQSTEIIPCRTALARRILNVLDEKWPDKSEMFLPGRMNYIIPIDDSEDTVTTIMRSKADATSQDETGTSYETDFALDQLINILAKVRQGKTNPSTSKKTKDWDRDDEMNDYGY